MEQKNSDAYQADTSPSGSTEKFNRAAENGPSRWSGVERFFRNDIGIYQTASERAAYRAGLSMAMAICDNLAAELHEDKRNKTWFAAKACGDKIEIFYRDSRRNGERTSGSSDSADCLKSDTSLKDSEA